MSDDNRMEGKLTTAVAVHLALTAASTVWIVIRTIYTTMHSGPSLVVPASYLLSLILLGLTGALILKKNRALFYLSLIGRGYLFLTIVLLLIRSENILNIGWLATVVCIIYLSILTYINPLRVYVSPYSYTRKVSGMFIAGRVAGGILFLVGCLTLYIFTISKIFPEYAISIRPQNYSEVIPGSAENDLPAHTWSDRWKVAIPDGLKPIEREIGIGAWKNEHGEKLIVTPGVWSRQVEEYAFIGFSGPYDFDRAVWRAGIGQPFLLVLKMIMANEGTRVYYYENPGVNATIVLKHLDHTSPPAWIVSANIYPEGEAPYTVETSSSSLERALLPVNMTLGRLGARS